MEITVDELAMIIGAKEIELFQARKELAKTRQVLEQVTRGEKENGSDNTQSEEGEEGRAG